jgi:hypothetical protein
MVFDGRRVGGGQVGWGVGEKFLTVSIRLENDPCRGVLVDQDAGDVPAKGGHHERNQLRIVFVGR